MKRGWLLGVGLLGAGAGAVLWGAMASKAPPPTQTPAQTTITDNTECPPRCTKEVERARAQALYPLVGPTPAMQKLQWLADEAGCPASDNPALMASCIRHKLWKGRDKARQRLERYEALIGLEREYWRILYREGLVPLTVHVPRYGPCRPEAPDGVPDSR